MKEKSHVNDIDRSIYDIRDVEKDAFRLEEGLTEDIVRKISEEKNDPQWMTEFRLNALKVYNEMPVPDWGPSIEGLDMDHIATYVRPNTKMQGTGKTFQRILRRHLRDWEFHRQSVHPWRELAHSTIQNLCTTMLRMKLQLRELCTLIWKVLLRVNMLIWFMNIS